MVEPLLSTLAAHAQAKALTPRTTTYLERLTRLRAPDVLQLHHAETYGEQTKQINITFPDALTRKWPHLELLQVGDVQFGHKDCRYDRVRAYRDWILEKPWRFVFLTGDLIDAAHAFTPGSTWDNILNQQSQVYRFCELMAPMAHRVLGYVGGNHERRGIPIFGDLGILLATMLQVPYSDGRQYVNLRFGEHKPFRVLLWHGHPRARTKGALAQILDRFGQIGNAHLYLTGHNHQSMVLPFHREISEAGKIRIEPYVVASSTSFLEVYGTYAEWMGFSAYDTLMPKAVLAKDGGWEMRLPLSHQGK